MKSKTELQGLLSSLTLSEKIGQMSQVFSDMLNEKNPNINEHREANGFENGKIYEVGSVSGIGGAKAVKALQRSYLENSRHKIPLLFMMDVIHGYRLNYQIAAGLGGAFDDDLVHRLSKMQANEAVSAGVSISYTPMSDMTNDPRWGRIMEIPSEDVYLNEKYMSTMVEAMQGDKKLESGYFGTCVKHIAGYGLAEGGRDYGDANVSKYALENNYYPLYKAGINAGSLMAMTAFNTLDGKPSTGNKKLLRNKLREEWGFEGVLISDHSSINELISHGYAKDERDAAKKAVEAGVDIELGTFLYRNNLEQLVLDGEVAESLIDEAVLRILELKNTLGLFDDPYAGIDSELETELTTSTDSRLLCREAGNKTITLLKNNNNILPFKNDIKFDLCGPLANTKDLIGFNACNGVLEDCVTVVEGLSGTDYNFISGLEYENYSEETLSNIINSDNEVVVFTVGEQSRYSGEGISRSSIKIPAKQVEFMAKVAESGKKLVTVVFSGRPLDLTYVSEISEALLFAWFPGTETGNSIADILFGKCNPSSKLSFSFPKDVGQIPLKYNHLNTGRPKQFAEQEYVNGYRDIDNDPLYPFGYGLSYSNFEYGELELDKLELTQDSEIKATVSVKNASEIDGDEIIQLYIRDLVAEYCRPVKELKAYKKISLEPGSTKQIEFTITLDDLTYYDEEGNTIYETGEFEVFVGASSEKVQSKIIELV